MKKFALKHVTASSVVLGVGATCLAIWVFQAANGYVDGKWFWGGSVAMAAWAGRRFLDN